jgi:GMP synthase-like glutamine amidotransferase
MIKNKKNKILILNVCKNKLHFFEFVKPIEEVLKKEKISFFTKHYLDLKKNDLKKFDKIIICGTSLRDNGYLNNLNNFDWIKDFKKPLLGICAGMQIISIVFNSNKNKLKNKKEIGFYYETFNENFLNIKKGEQQVYLLHKNYVPLPGNFKKFTSSKIPQAIKHQEKEIYGVLFHPEVRQKDLIKEFIK